MERKLYEVTYSCALPILRPSLIRDHEAIVNHHEIIESTEKWIIYKKTDGEPYSITNRHTLGFQDDVSVKITAGNIITTSKHLSLDNPEKYPTERIEELTTRLNVQSKSMIFETIIKLVSHLRGIYVDAFVPKNIDCKEMGEFVEVLDCICDPEYKKEFLSTKEDISKIWNQDAFSSFLDNLHLQYFDFNSQEYIDYIIGFDHASDTD